MSSEAFLIRRPKNQKKIDRVGLAPHNADQLFLPNLQGIRTMKLHAMIKPALAVFATAALLGSVGCASNTVSATQVRLNPTPRLQSLTRSYEENLNLFARTQNNRWRAIHDDFQTAFFLNRNTGLDEFEYPNR